MNLVPFVVVVVVVVVHGGILDDCHSTASRARRVVDNTDVCETGTRDNESNPREQEVDLSFRRFVLLVLVVLVVERTT